MNFDLKPLVQAGGYKIIVRLFLSALPVALLLKLTGHSEFALSFFRGIVVGVLDTAIMFTGMKRALPYEKEPRKGLNIMSRYYVYRIASAGSIFVLMLRMKYPVFGASLGFLLIHIFLIINLLFFAYRLNKKEA